ncbi:DUF1330 domain-containing protein [Actinoplanes sp. GCM10030250]|uniref:DUF1330 domain-containing protein n=1 Tax=Actinoplanes sp. GCM10030250 TaxID=3273376 RepID=UPI003615EC38
MTAYAIAHLRPAGMTNDVIDYIDRIQDTMDPFGGRFLVHMAEVEVVEGEWPGAVVVIEFPDTAAIHAWYASPAYTAILPLRTRHIDGDVIVVEGVGPDYDPRKSAAALRSSLNAV